MSKVKIKAVRDIAIEKKFKKNGEDVVSREVIKAGQVAEVSEEEAKMFCDQPFKVTLESWGPCDKKFKYVNRAERVA